ncbi:flavonol synthase/flavanone 3-hydroxylase [Ricinus communis]|uniref:Flavonol synthase/flavanone 3-hydroxylase, putative n=1 Tax=Ricinus communis TaxID=3988 RepID=B9R992_RICCO|nr:flavonol synthase/flavanone 3-hydroxylase [Ricinus communis]EEF52169.1 Flavonol synthase/flavanone 3-hydroxylase, putative [Ricinus communis]|eukprot:XP_002511567.1 flavonol synthase/flavanone 3-hydroxylase [Ricinus communis]
MANWSIPTVDLSPFFKEDDKDGKKKAMETISQACSEYGFFQIENHGVPLELMKQALKLSKEFFDFSYEEKRKYSPESGAPLPAGYSKQPEHSPDKNEYVLVFPPGSGFNVYPPNPPGFREVLEGFFSYLTKTGSLIESIINECLGLPHNFLKAFNHDRSWDFLVALRYFPATKSENNGLTDHEDGNCLTFVFQDEAAGLQVRKNGEWIPVAPTENSIVVNVGDIIQVLSNNKFKSATHRVVRPEGKSRYSYAFFYNLQGDKWVEPLPKFTKEIGELPKYRGFLFKEYQELRMRNKSHPPSRPEDVIHITHYAINN